MIHSKNIKNALLKIPGATLAFGGGKLKGGENIPECYGSFEPTAVKIPIQEGSPTHIYALFFFFL